MSMKLDRFHHWLYLWRRRDSLARWTQVCGSFEEHRVQMALLEALVQCGGFTAG